MNFFLFGTECYIRPRNKIGEGQPVISKDGYMYEKRIDEWLGKKLPELLLGFFLNF